MIVPISLYVAGCVGIIWRSRYELAFAPGAEFVGAIVLVLLWPVVMPIAHVWVLVEEAMQKRARCGGR
jgi:hypothetical protein